MMQQTPNHDKPFWIFEGIDLVALQALPVQEQDEMLAATRESISYVLQEFLAAKGLTAEALSVIDGFIFLFNEPSFASWHSLNWWEQRRLIRTIRDHQLYTGRAQTLLDRSCLAPYIHYSDDMVAKSTDLQVKHAWMRKRLVLKECFWNAIDSFSHAAYHQQKYQGLFPALGVLLCNIIDKNGRETELVLGIDNGTGFQYKKKSRDSVLFRFLYKGFKFVFRKGVFYIGGLELGLLETDSELSCHGAGCVVYQGW